jgi:heptosyltransferase-3
MNAVPLKHIERGGKRVFARIAAGLLRAEGGAGEPAPGPLPVAGLRSVLLLRPDRLGDFVLTVPAIESLRARLSPDARLTLLVSARNEALARWFFPEARRWVHGRGLRPFLRTLARLVSHRFDAAIDFHSYPFSVTTGLWTLVSGARIRVGHRATGRNDELARAIFNEGVTAYDDGRHESEKARLLVERFAADPASAGSMPPVPRFPAARARVDEWLAAAGAKAGDRWIAIHPTLAKPDNHWSPGRYLELLRLLEPVPALRVIVVHGAGEERERAEFRAAAQRPGLVFLPTGDLETIVEAARRCEAVVCGDSGIAHLCALVTRTIVIFGPANPCRWTPIGPREVVVLRAASGVCDDVTPAEVMEALMPRRATR